MATEIYLETGKKKVFAASLRWPGWARFAASEEAAIEALATYGPRYAAFSKAAGVPFRAATDFTVVERMTGSGNTDFGVPNAPATADSDPVAPKERQRLAKLLQGAWVLFDATVADAPAELRKGPRGGGRDRDKIADHVVEAESAYVRKIGLKSTATREDILAAIREPEGEWKWPLPYAARRFTWHVLDHVWEIEDRSTAEG